MKQTSPGPHPLWEPPREPRRFLGTVVSLLLHLALLVLVIQGAVDTFIATPAAGNLAKAGGGGGGGGAQGLRYISLPALTPATPVQQPAVPPPEVAPPTPVPTVTQSTEVAVVPQPDSIPVAGGASAAAGSGPGAGGGSGGGSGGGVGPGVGTGSGPGTGGGAGGSGREPQWTYGTPWVEKAPKELRGQTLSVTFHIQADGRVASLDVVPEIKDRDYARRFNEAVGAYRFKPARNAEGVAVPGAMTMTFTLSSK